MFKNGEILNEITFSQIPITLQQKVSILNQVSIILFMFMKNILYNCMHNCIGQKCEMVAFVDLEFFSLADSFLIMLKTG